MDAFAPSAPTWTDKASHVHTFCCPTCGRSNVEASQNVWINRRSPVYSENQKRKWQEFYHCECGTAWWAWSNDRPPSELGDRPPRESDRPFSNPFDDW
ncbi:MAG: hypothetical protein H7237_11190 [Alkalinema sp. FL-bin-369]|nr:hypothetical protein [Leptolyngbyaceae cyanobacterium LF-bin-369]